MSYFYLFLYIFLLCLLDCYCQLVGGWEYLNVQCRDNDNEAVDWWYVYKPPSNIGGDMDSGANFSYITANIAGRWQASRVHIFGKSLLKYTLAPMYKKAYRDYVASVVYEEQQPTENFKGSAAFGVLLANDMGGVWIGHSVPGFPALTKGKPIFPTLELPNGHMIMCLSLDLQTMNSLAIAVKQTEPYIQRMIIPATLKDRLPDWVNLLGNDEPEVKASKTAVRKTKILPFMTKGKSLRGIVLARSPGDSRCLYKSFAKTKGIVMDVYGHREHQNAICDKTYSLRNIDAISLKYPEHVFYIDNATDSMGFAVSTVGVWQRPGRSRGQHWACTGNVENQPLSSKGGIIACVFNFQVWLSFDNFKVKEPECG